MKLKEKLKSIAVEIIAWITIVAAFAFCIAVVVAVFKVAFFM